MLGVIYGLAASHALMFASVVWRKSQAGQAGRYLFWILLLMSYKLAEGALSFGASNPDWWSSNNSWSGIWPHLLGWAPLAVLWLGPLLMAYTRKMSGEATWTWRQCLWHFSPAILVLILQLPEQLLTADEKRWLWQHSSGEGLSWQVVMLLVVVKFHLGSYLWSSWQHLRDLSRHSLHQHSDDWSDCLRWQQRLCGLLMALEAIWVLLFVLQQSIALTTLSQVGDLWLLAMAVIVLLLAYWGLSHPAAVLSRPQVMVNSVDTHDEQHGMPEPMERQTGEVECASEHGFNAQEKYLGSPVDAGNAPELLEHMQHILRERQLFLQPQLRLSDLATACELRTHIISQLINQYLAMNFYQFINSLRVEYAQTLMQNEGQGMSLERIAVESGFSNRVTFNKAFKAQLQMTPSSYRKRLNTQQPMHTLH